MLRIIDEGVEMLIRKKYNFQSFNDSCAAERIFDSVWGMEAVGDMSTVTVHVNKLRDKIEDDPSDPQYIQTVWGVGYRFKL